MTIEVLDSKDQLEALRTGVIPMPKEVAADNARQAEKRGETPAPVAAAESTAPVENPDPVKEAQAAADALEDVEGEDGLTARQKREFTASMQKAIAKKHRAQREAEEFAAAQYNEKRMAEERARELAAELERVKRQAAPAKEAPTKLVPPDRTKFESDEAYQSALIDYRVEQKWQAAQAEEQRQREAQENERLEAEAAARIQQAAQLVPDFLDKIQGAQVMTPNYVLNHIVQSDLGPELAYYLADHPETVTKLSEFTKGLREGTPQFARGITRALVEIGKIESRLQPFAQTKVKSNGEAGNGEAPSTTATAPSRETGSAPSKSRVQAPVFQPLNSGSAAQVDKSPSERSTREEIEAWQKKRGAALTARKRH